MLFKDDTLYFLHLRKTGGTTLLTVLDNNFHQDEALNSRYWTQLLDNMPTDFSKYRLIGGHFGYRFHQLLPKKPLFMTILRDPIDHSISNFNHRKHERVCEPERRFYIDKTIDDIVTHPTERLKYLNPQVRDIANDQLVELSEAQLVKLQRTNQDIYEGRSEQEILKIAIQRLKEFVFVGILERYQESLFLLAYTFGWAPIKDIIARNVTTGSVLRKGQLTESTLKNIQELTTLDRQLYEYGKQIFEERYNAMIKELRSKYYRPMFNELPEKDAIYEMLQLWYSEIYEKKYPIKHDIISIDFKDILNGWGWQDREEIPETGKRYRWTGPERRSVIDLPLKKDNDLEIRIGLIGSMTEEILKSFRLKVNDDENTVPLTVQPDAERMLKGTIPKSFLQNKYSFTRIILEVNKTLAPRSIDPNSDDERLLGVAVNDIRINPAKHG